MKHSKNTAIKGGNINLQLTTKSEGLLRYMSIGVYKKSVKADAKDTDSIAANLRLGGNIDFSLSYIIGYSFVSLKPILRCNKYKYIIVDCFVKFNTRIQLSGN